MNRRRFLKAALGAAGVVLLPIPVVAEPHPLLRGLRAHWKSGEFWEPNKLAEREKPLTIEVVLRAVERIAKHDAEHGRFFHD
jgi:hypothetical protein